MRELADGVYAYVQPDGGWCVNNAGLITDNGSTVLIDTAATQARTDRLAEAVNRVAGPPSVLVNTHHHGDHIFGNARFAPPATVVAHELAREEIIEAGLGLRSLWPDVDWGDTPLVLPTLTFRDSLTLHVGDLRVELIHLGPAHTTNDVVAWIPDRKVVFTGDIVMSDVTPFCLMGSVEGSLRAIERLRGLGAQTVVSGHGPVTGPDTFAINERYLRFVQDLAERGRRAGLEPLDVARDTDLGEFADLIDPERLVGNLHRAYAELAGEPLGGPIPLLPPLQQMFAYHGGPLPCHA
jgi:cyclase